MLIELKDDDENSDECEEIEDYVSSSFIMSCDTI